MNRVMASRTIERHKAIKKTALKKAPRISALNHYRKVSRCPSTWHAEKTYTKRIFVGARLLRSLDSPESDEQRDDIVQL